MRKQFLIIAVVFLTVWANAKDDKAKFKSVEVKHFTLNEGVELPPEFKDFLYAELRADLQKKKVAEQLVGEDEVVDPADAAQSVIIEGSVLEYKKGSLVKEKLIGFGAGLRSLTAHVKVTRRSDHEALLDEDLKVRVPAEANPEHLARFLASEITGKLKKEARSSGAGAVPVPGM
jgi:hypothetical protein